LRRQPVVPPAFIDPFSWRKAKTMSRLRALS
jgi:hypothetical protein